MESIVGKILCDRYRVIQELSQDDFSTIYVAEDLEQPQKPQCHLEQILPHYDNEVLGAQSWQKVLQTFIERATILKNLSQHPQIPQLLDFFECDREFYLVRECIEGETLAGKLQRSPIAEAEAITWLQEILGILEFVHQAKIAHLNIQPLSLIEHRDGRKFLTNFATVKNAILGDSNSLPIVVNSDFAASELKLGKPDYSSDIYALGKTLIYALTGKVTEQIQPQFSKVKALNSSESNLSEGNIRPELANVLTKMVAELPGDRYQSVTEVLAELDSTQDVVTFPPPFFNDLTFSARPNSQSSKTKRELPFANRPKIVQKIIWSLLALPFVIASGIVLIGIDKNSYRSFDNYVNNDYDFAIEYPQNWSQKELNDPITGGIVVFTSPPEADSDTFREKVYITVETSTETTSLEQYTQTVLERIEDTEGSDVEVYDNFKTTIDNFPARTVIYSREEDGLSLRQMEVFTIRNNRVYVAIYTAEQAKFSKFLKTAQKIVDSWEIQ